MVDVNETIGALRALKKGQSYVYHTGLLGKDRQVGPEKSEICLIADVAWQLMEEKKVSLVQRRVGPFSCEYIAQAV